MQNANEYADAESIGADSGEPDLSSRADDLNSIAQVGGIRNLDRKQIFVSRSTGHKCSLNRCRLQSLIERKAIPEADVPVEFLCGRFSTRTRKWLFLTPWPCCLTERKRSCNTTGLLVMFDKFH